jgi:hypothetical protein
MRCVLSLLVLFGVLAGTGCAGYRLGPTNPDMTGGKTVQVQYFQNQTIEPRLVEAVNQNLRQCLQQDGSLKLDTHGDADIVVSGTLLEFERRPMSFQPKDVITVTDYEVRLKARVKAVERSTGRVLFERVVTGRTTESVGTDLASAERQSVPLLAQDLARNITTLLVEGAW